MNIVEQLVQLANEHDFTSEQVATLTFAEAIFPDRVKELSEGSRDRLKGIVVTRLQEQEVTGMLPNIKAALEGLGLIVTARKIGNNAFLVKLTKE